MAALPWFRAQVSTRVFQRTGVDMFGPMYVTVKRTKEKRYGCIFTCLATRAVHLEFMYQADADSFVQAYRRFVCTRDKPDDMYSDNGTNFVAGDKEINDGISRWNHARLSEKLAQEGVNWHYNPASAPHFGGAWERLIQSAKKALKAVLHGQGRLNDEILATAMKEIENLMNNRPLTHISMDPNDPSPLTPNHLLKLSGLPVQLPDIAEMHDHSSRKRYRRAQAIVEAFWRRWIHEYLPNMIERRKWLQPRANVQVGDLVVVVDDQAKRDEWMIGRVVQTHPSKKDGVVRGATVNVKGKIYNRPVSRLCLLEEDAESVSE